MLGVILYGPPGAGKDTVTNELLRINGRYRPYSRIKVGPGRTTGYRMADQATVDALRAENKVLWENQRYEALYVVDLPSLVDLLNSCTPVLHLGQRMAVQAIRDGIPTADWLIVSLWCPREVAAERITSRGSTDLTQRLRAWDETESLPSADLSIDTGDVSASRAAELIDQAVRGREVLAGGSQSPKAGSGR